MTQPDPLHVQAPPRETLSWWVGLSRVELETEATRRAPAMRDAGKSKIVTGHPQSQFDV